MNEKRGERELRDHYGITAEAYLPEAASDIHALAVDLYSAWRRYEWPAWKPSMEEEFAPPLFFHLAIELITISRRDPNLRSTQHILFKGGKLAIE